MAFSSHWCWGVGEQECTRTEKSLTRREVSVLFSNPSLLMPAFVLPSKPPSLATSISFPVSSVSFVPLDMPNLYLHSPSSQSTDGENKVNTQLVRDSFNNVSLRLESKRNATSLYY